MMKETRDLSNHEIFEKLKELKAKREFAQGIALIEKSYFLDYELIEELKCFYFLSEKYVMAKKCCAAQMHFKICSLPLIIIEDLNINPFWSSFVKRNDCHPRLEYISSYPELIVDFFMAEIMMECDALLNVRDMYAAYYDEYVVHYMDARNDYRTMLLNGTKSSRIDKLVSHMKTDPVIVCCAGPFLTLVDLGGSKHENLKCKYALFESVDKVFASFARKYDKK